MGPNLREVLIRAIELDAWVYLIPIAGVIGLLARAF
jgi:hypothetical protein